MSAAPSAGLQLRGAGGARVGSDRIALLQAIADHGSISLAARELGLTFRSAWDAVQALNNLFSRPLVAARPGGVKGGGAELTQAGRSALAAFVRLEERLEQLVGELNDSLDGAGPLLGGGLLWSFGMRTSARNAFRGVVESVAEGAVNTEVTLRVSPKVSLVATVTRQSAEDLGLVPGREAVALIKSSFVVLAPGCEPLRTSARNQLEGVVVRHTPGAVNDEVTLEVDDGKTLTATITRGSGEALGFAEGQPARALIKASHIILGVD